MSLVADPVANAAPEGDPLGLVGATVDGRYLVEAALSAPGGLRVVYRARYVELDVPVALECLDPVAEDTVDADTLGALVEAFRESTRLHYRLAQGNLHIARSLARGTVNAPARGGDAPYVVREWIEGRSLEAELAARRAAGARPPTLGETIAAFDTAAGALAHAQAQGVAHHHVDPRRLLVRARTESAPASMIVRDFGFAGILARLRDERRLADASESLGLLDPRYAAPEQLDPALGAVGPWTDVYALAVVLREALGSAPLAGDVEELFERALARDPARRPRDVASLWSDLQSAVLATTERRRSLRATAAAAMVRPAPSPAPAPTPGDEAEDPSVFDRPTTRPPAVAEDAPPSSDERRESMQVFALPTLNPPAAKLRGRTAAFVAAAALAFGALAGGLVFRARHGATTAAPPPAPAPATATAEATATATTASMEEATAMAMAAATTEPLAEAPAPATPARSAVATYAPASAPTHARARAAKTTTRSGGGAPLARARPVAWITNDAHAFDVRAATRSLATLERILASCSRAGERGGAGTARVTFSPDGGVARVDVGAPFAGTRQGACVAERLGAARVPAFRGAPATLRTSFHVPD